MTLTPDTLVRLAARDTTLRQAAALLPGGAYDRATQLVTAVGRFHGVRNPRSPLGKLIRQAESFGPVPDSAAVMLRILRAQ